jgi:hypothetical protein
MCRQLPGNQAWTTPEEDGARVAALRRASYAELPVLSAPAFVWHRDAWPQALELRVDGAPGPGRHSVRITRGAAPQSDLRVRLLRAGGNRYLVEWLGLDTLDTAFSNPRLEFWWWADAGDGFGCLVPQRADGTEGDGARRIKQVYQVLLEPHKPPVEAFGRPHAAGWRTDLLTAGDVHRLRWLLELQPPAGEELSGALPYAFALSLQVAGRQHLVSHVDLRFADPTSFAQSHDAITDDLEAPDAAWLEAVTLHRQMMGRSSR